ncbi:hypothetical protein EYF80_024737 [Liparis tanakae]|uniref:Secreted protein n=1 Tax=Liparis tanakae TaxID=230148 RepID=A0A4Z2HGJ6_9TELE|nr:hypothetical protein EYF80_024737 [Liparis tanakae]
MVERWRRCCRLLITAGALAVTETLAQREAQRDVTARLWSLVRVAVREATPGCTAVLPQTRSDRACMHERRPTQGQKSTRHE